MSDLDDLRFPIGKRNGPAASTPAIRAAQTETLRRLPAKLREAVKGLNDAQLDTPYREGGWTVRQVVHHVADSHGVCLVRWKLALTEEWPTINAYSEDAWAKLADHRLPVEISLDLIAALHGRWVAMIEAMSEADFHRGYAHPERGRTDLVTTLGIYEWHSRHHTAHITNLRARQGW